VTTVVDTNVIAALWESRDAVNRAARTALDDALDRGGLIVPAPVFAELLAFPRRTEAFLNTFFRDTGIAIDWHVSEGVWRAAGRAFGAYASRRRQGRSVPRRILADFLIGAYAEQNGYTLLTLDRGIYRPAFPKLKLVSW
jgi:predicted nucleic acid-binding protein